MLFAQEGSEIRELATKFGLDLADVRTAPEGAPWSIREIDEAHPLFAGVFRTSRQRRVVESPRIERLRPADGGMVIASSDAGAFLTEGQRGAGTVIYLGSGS